MTDLTLIHERASRIDSATAVCECLLDVVETLKVALEDIDGWASEPFTDEERNAGIAAVRAGYKLLQAHGLRPMQHEAS